MNDLKPCPFCGCDDIAYGNCIGNACFECRFCLALGPVGDSQKEAVEKWNTRARPKKVYSKNEVDAWVGDGKGGGDE